MNYMKWKYEKKKTNKIDQEWFEKKQRELSETRPTIPTNSNFIDLTKIVKKRK